MNTQSYNVQKLETLSDASKKVLYKASTVFPFTFFPDKISVDETKLNIVRKIFFGSELVTAISIQDIVSVSVSSNPIFSTLTVEVHGIDPNPEPIRFLWNKDATKFRRIILGLITAKKEGLDTSNIPFDTVATNMERIGTLNR